MSFDYVGRRRAAKGECRIRLEDIAGYSTGLLAGVVPPPDCEQLPAADVRRYRDLFGTSCYLLAELHKVRTTMIEWPGSKTYHAKPVSRSWRQAMSCSIFPPGRCCTTF